MTPYAVVFFLWLRWSLILACSFPELGTLCTVINAGKSNIPVRTPKWPPRLILQGYVTARKLVPLPRHVTNLRGCELAMWARNCGGSFFDFFRFAILYSQRWILVNLNASTIAFIKIWANCPRLFYMLTNTTLSTNCCLHREPLHSHGLDTMHICL